jgi:flagellar hook protein FlgE
MGLSSSLSASVSGLEANATRLSTISDNISNSNTIGYKQASTEFGALVMGTNTANIYNAGGVETYIKRDISEHGLLSKTSNALDIAMDGTGFFPVTIIADANNYNAGSAPVHFSTTGSFSENKDGFLKNTQGQYLLGWPLDAAGKTVPNVSRTTTSDLEPVNTQIIQFTVSPTTRVELQGNLPADYTETGSTSAGTVITKSIPYVDKLGNKHNLTATFTPTVGSAVVGTDTVTTWTVAVTDGASTPAATIGSFNMRFDEQGMIYDLPTITTGSYTAATGQYSMTTADGANIDMYIGLIGEQKKGLTQFAKSSTASSTNDIITASADGAELSQLNHAEIDEKGVVYAIFDNQQKRAIFQIPVATVENPNKMQTLTGQSYAVTAESGDFTFRDAGQESIGKTMGYSLERSTVEVAKQLTDLIETQRAYSSNAKVIQTVDEMFQETTSIKR